MGSFVMSDLSEAINHARSRQKQVETQQAQVRRVAAAHLKHQIVVWLNWCSSPESGRVSYSDKFKFPKVLKQYDKMELFEQLHTDFKIKVYYADWKEPRVLKNTIITKHMRNVKKFKLKLRKYK